MKELVEEGTGFPVVSQATSPQELACQITSAFNPPLNA